MKYSSIQSEYKNLQSADPSQVNLKHMIDQETFFVWGKLTSESGRYSNSPLVIVAYSNKFKENEQVDTMFLKGTGTHYGLNLPEGGYTFLVYADLNEDNVFQQSEVVGKRELILNASGYPEKTVKDIDIGLTMPIEMSWAQTILMSVLIETERPIYYPAGTIRSLDDSMFDEKIATMGMYDPASFLEHAKTMFYALEERVPHKIPVIFVHGIGGSSRSFKTIIEHMDNDRYQAWFFYYPSGGDLDQLADFFYSIFLSGQVITQGEMPLIVVAHSMGGLVVRDAINRYQGKVFENKVELFVSIASPFGGHPSAASGEKHGLFVLPAWKDLNPSSDFINELHRKPLPNFLEHQLFYAYNNSSAVKFGENSDGVVPLSSQLHPKAQQQSVSQFGFNSSHVDILEDENMIEQLLNEMQEVDNIFPDSHMELLVNGGFDVKLAEDYSSEVRHLIGYAGKYLMMLVSGKIQPINSQQERYIQAIKGEITATKGLEKEFIRFMSEYSELINTFLEGLSKN